MSRKLYDFVIVGGGVVGLTVAYELRLRHPGASILVLEKELELGRHSSGRNSGVLHSGIYYKPGTLKAKMCAQGQREWISYCSEHHLPISPLGKVIVPTSIADGVSLGILCDNASANGVKYHVIDRSELGKVEPDADTATNHALYLPHTPVIDPLVIMHHLGEQVKQKGIDIERNLVRINKGKAQARVQFEDGEYWSDLDYGHLINCAGLHADVIANGMDHCRDYNLDMIPVKGYYYKLSKGSGIHLQHLLYPVPNLEMPFLGVHFTNNVYGDTYVGPSAIPVFGRECYNGIMGDPLEAGRILMRLAMMFVKNKQNFRKYAYEEGGKFLKSNFAAHAQKMVPKLRPRHLLTSHKCGIRPQLVNTKTGEMVMDMLVVSEKRHTHVLNAISPAFTCAWPFARFVVDKVTSNG